MKMELCKTCNKEYPPTVLKNGICPTCVSKPAKEITECSHPSKQHEWVYMNDGTARTGDYELGTGDLIFYWQFYCKWCLAIKRIEYAKTVKDATAPGGARHIPKKFNVDI